MADLPATEVQLPQSALQTLYLSLILNRCQYLTTPKQIPHSPLGQCGQDSSVSHQQYILPLLFIKKYLRNYIVLLRYFNTNSTCEDHNDQEHDKGIQFLSLTNKDICIILTMEPFAVPFSHSRSTVQRNNCEPVLQFVPALPNLGSKLSVQFQTQLCIHAYRRLSTLQPPWLPLNLGNPSLEAGGTGCGLLNSAIAQVEGIRSWQIW